MKKLVLSIAIVLCCGATSLSWGQKIQAVDVTTKVNKVDRPAIMVASEAEVKPLQAAWAAHLKKSFKVKAKKSRNAVTAEAASIPSISENKFDLNTTYKMTPEGCEMIVTGASGYDMFFSPKDQPEAYRKLKTEVEEFVKSYMAVHYDKLIAEKQKVIDASVKEEQAMEKEVVKLEKSNAKAAATIEKLQKQIDRDGATIQSNKEALPTMKQTIEQKKVLLKELEAKKSNVTGK